MSDAEKLTAREIGTWVLGILSLLLLVGGGITWGIAKSSYDAAVTAYGYSVALEGTLYADNGPVQTAQAWISVGVVAVILGVLVLVTWIVMLSTNRRPAVQAAAPASAEIANLAKLHDSGVLNDDEFTAAKNRLLNPHA